MAGHIFHPVSELVEQLVSWKGRCSAPALVTGAGASYPLPTAREIKEKLLGELVELAHYPHTGDHLRDTLLKRINEPIMTLENMFYLIEQVLDDNGKTSLFDPDTVIRNFLGWLDPEKGSTAPGALAIAMLRQAGYVGPIVTPNFDDLIPKTLKVLAGRRGVGDFRVLTNEQMDVPGQPEREIKDDQIIAFHGTLFDQGPERYTRPRTLVARGLVRPFSPHVYAWFNNLLADEAQADRPIVLFGYSGGDIYDFNAVIKSVRDKVDLRRLHWVSYKGDGSDLSWAAKELNCNYYAGDFASAVLQRRDIFPVDEQFDRFRLVRGRDGTVVSEVTRPLFTGFKLPKHADSDSAAGRAREVIDAFLSRFVGVWAVSEHYALESYGFSQVEITALGKPVTTDGKHFRFDYCDIDVSLFIDAQADYWAEQGKAIGLIEQSGDVVLENPGDVLHIGFPKAGRQFHNLLLATGEQLRRLGEEPLQPASRHDVSRRLDIAMLYVLHAIAYDYLGLMAMRVATARSKAGQVALEEASAYAVMLFDRSEACAEAARKLWRPEEIPLLSACQEIVPYQIWSMIARENRARALLDKDFQRKATALAQCFRERCALIEDVEEAIKASKSGRSSIRGSEEKLSSAQEIRLFMIPQAALRGAELVKLYFGCSGETDVLTTFPAREAHPGAGVALDDGTTLHIEQILAGLSGLFEKWRIDVAMQNYRFISVVESRALAMAAKGQFKEAYEWCKQEIERHFNLDTDEKAAKFARNAIERLKKLQRTEEPST